MGARTEMTRPIAQDRTCVAERAPCARDAAIRWFAGPDGSAWPDWTGRARVGGRGAWTCADPACVAAIADGRALSRAVRAPVRAVPPSELVARAAAAGERVFLERLGLATRAGAAAVGEASSREAMRGAGWLLLVADDAGESGVARAEANAIRKGRPVARVASGGRLGAATGRDFVSVIVIQASRFETDITRLAAGLAAFPDTLVTAFADGERAAEAGSELPPNGV